MQTNVTDTVQWATATKNIPEELRDRKQWLRWGFRDKEQTQKIPLYVNGTWAKTNAPDSFHSFDEVNQCDRVAYVIQGDDPYTGIDLDGCLDSDGHLVEWARAIVERLCRVGYAEISPSGKGIKILTRAKKPEGSRCVHKMGEGKQQLEVYDFNRFWAMTGDVYMLADEIGDGQEAIDWLCNEYLQQDSVRTEDNFTFTVDPRGNLWGFNADDYEPYCAEDHETLQYEIYPSSKLQRRAESYLSAADRPGTGNRNNAAFGLAGHLRAIDEHGERLTEEQIIGYMRQWNASLPEPLDDRELLQAVRSSRCNGTRRAPKEAQETSGDWDPDRAMMKAYQAEQRAQHIASVEEIIESEGDNGDHFTLDDMPEESACEVTEAIMRWAATRHPGSALHEILEYCHGIRRTSFTAPCLATALGSISCLASWNYRSPSADPNLYIVLTGATSTGKNMPMEVVPEILRECGVGDRVTSEPGSFQKLNDNFLSNSAFCLVWDEIGVGLKRYDKAYQNGVIAVLNSAYTSPRNKRKALIASKQDRQDNYAVYPHPTLVASSTPAEFAEGFSAGGSAGLMTRVITMHLPAHKERTISRAKRRELREQGTPPLPSSLIHQCKMILHRGAPSTSPTAIYIDPAEASRVQKIVNGVEISVRGDINADNYFRGQEIGISDDALEYLLDIEEEVDRAKVTSEERRQVLARFAQNVGKVALVIAVGVHADEIDREMIELAVRVVSASCLATGANYLLAGDTEGEKCRGRILSTLSDAKGAGKHLGSLRRSCSRDAQTRKRVLEALIDSGEIRVFSVSTSGAPKRYAVAPKHVKQFLKKHPDATLLNYSTE